MATTVEEAIYRMRVEGEDRLRSATSALDGMAVAEERVNRATRSTTQGFERLLSRLDPRIRAEQQLQRVREQVARYEEAGVGTAAARDRALVLATQRYNEHVAALNHVGNASKYATGQFGLARHELVNLSRQVQDVGVTLASGQSPMTILVQQGTQIADIFASSQGTVRGFFSQITSWISSFLTPARLAVGGVAAFGTAAVVAAAQWSSGQRDIDRALSGIGRASGVTRDQINQIGQASSSAFGLSASEAREAATTFAATGKIYGDNVALATDLTKNFARATGTDAADAQKALTKAMLDPVAGAQELNKTLGFLDATTLQYIRTLQTSGRTQEAQRALLEALNPTVTRMASNVGLMSKSWDLATNAVSHFYDTWSRAVARTAERATGANLGGFTNEEQLARARERLSALQSSPFQGRLAQPGIKAAAEEVARLEEAIRKAAEAAGDARFQQFALEAEGIARSIIPQVEQIDKLTEAIAKLQRAQAERAGRGLAPDATLDAGANAARTQLALAMETQDVERRRAEYVARVAVEYKNVSAAVAVGLRDQEFQLAIAQAVTGQERLAAQERHAYNQALAEGRTHVEAEMMAASQRAVAQAQINTQAQQTLAGLREQEAVSAAVTGEERLKAQAAATYAQHVREGVDAQTALSLATQQMANAQAQINAGAQANLLSLQEQYLVITASSQEERMRAEAAATYNRLIREGVDAELARATAAQQFANAQEQARRSAEAHEETNRRSIKSTLLNAAAAQRMADEWERAVAATERYYFRHQFVPTTPAPSGDIMGKNIWERGGRFTQFNPAGYVSTMDPVLSGPASHIPGGAHGGGLTWQNGAWMPNQQGATMLADETLGKGGDISSAFLSVLRIGVTDASMGVLRQLMDLMPDDAQKGGAIERLLREIESQPASLAREALIKQLNEELSRLRGSTDDLNETMRGILSPFYSQDPRMSHLGFRSGFASGGSFIVPGGISANDNVMAHIPLASGEEVTIRTPEQQRVQGSVDAKPNVTINAPITVTVQGSADEGALDEFKMTALQASQRIARMVAGGSR